MEAVLGATARRDLEVTHMQACRFASTTAPTVAAALSKSKSKSKSRTPPTHPPPSCQSTTTTLSSNHRLSSPKQLSLFLSFFPPSLGQANSIGCTTKQNKQAALRACLDLTHFTLVCARTRRLWGFQARTLSGRQTARLPACLPCPQGTLLSQTVLIAGSRLALSPRRAF